MRCAAWKTVYAFEVGSARNEAEIFGSFEAYVGHPGRRVLCGQWQRSSQRHHLPRGLLSNVKKWKGWHRIVSGPGPGWQVGRWGHDLYQNMTFGGARASQLRTAMTDAGDNPAEISSEFVIPRDGNYKIWVKYECPPFFNYAFGVRVERRDPAGGVVFEKVYGLREAAKHFCFKEELVSGDLYWNWGIDHDAAEGYPGDTCGGKISAGDFQSGKPVSGGLAVVGCRPDH